MTITKTTILLGLLFLVLPHVSHAVTLSAQVAANPASGAAPLTGVDLTATVSGTATGPITYKFDCTGDGSWERIEASNNTSFIATDLCSYSSAGNYIAKIEVERGGLAFMGATAVLVKAGNSLSVTLSANPSSGPAPLNGVDLTAAVAGNGSGNITYRFDCTGDGSYERTETTGSAFFTAVDVCSYANPGSYTAKVQVQRGELSFQGGTTVNALSQTESGNVVLRAEKLGRNITKGQTEFSGGLLANPGDEIEFQLRLSSVGSAEARSVLIRDALPTLLNYQGGLKIDGQSSGENIVTGLTVSSIPAGSSKVFTFRVRVAGADGFRFGNTDLVNTVLAFSSQVATSTAFKLTVYKAGSPTIIPTGALDNRLAAALVALTVLFGLSYLYLARHYWLTKLLPLAFKSKQERRLARAIERARQRRSQ